MTAIIKVAIYVRVSTLEQAEEGYSIEAQLGLLRDHCQNQGKTIVKEYSDPGVSGSSRENRKGLAQLLRDAEAGCFQEVIVWKLNRLARNSVDLLEMIETFEHKGIQFHSLSESFDNTALGKFQLQALANVAQFELATIRDNVRAGRMQRAKGGKWCGGVVLGYESAPVVEGSEETFLKVVPEEAEIVREIFERYAAGKGYRAIVNYLNKNGYRTKKGKYFSLPTVRTILRNPVYIGQIRYFDLNEKRYLKAKGEHKPIISESLWQKVQRRLASKTKAKKESERFYPLTHLLRCPICGAGMIGWHHFYTQRSDEIKRYDYYICSRFHNKGSAVCKANAVKAFEAEQAVIEQVQSLVNQPKVLKDIVNRVNGRYQQSERLTQGKLRAVDQSLKRVKAYKRQVFTRFEEDQMSKDTFAEKIQALKADETDLMKQREGLISELTVQQAPRLSYTQVKAALRSLDQLLQGAPNDKKSRLLYTMIESITINRQREPKSLCIHFHPQFLPIPVPVDSSERSLS